MIKKQCRVLVAKEQCEALKQQRGLAGRAKTLTAGVFLLRGGRGAEWGVMKGLSQVGGRHMPAEGHACVYCVHMSVCVFTKARVGTRAHIVPPWRQPDSRGLSGSKPPSSCHQSTTCRRKTFTTHTNTKCPREHTLFYVHTHTC